MKNKLKKYERLSEIKIYKEWVINQLKIKIKKNINKSIKRNINK